MCMWMAVIHAENNRLSHTSRKADQHETLCTVSKESNKNKASNGNQKHKHRNVHSAPLLQTAQDTRFCHDPLQGK